MRWIVCAVLVGFVATMSGCPVTVTNADLLRKCQFPPRPNEITSNDVDLSSYGSPDDSKRRAMAKAMHRQSREKHFKVNVNRSKSAARKALGNNKGVYGTDDRRDYYQLSPTHQGYARAACLITDVWDLQPVDKNNPSSKLILSSYSYSDYLEDAIGPVCSSEPFINQKTAGFCTGFLVTADVVLTAGHCVADYVDGVGEEQWEEVPGLCDDACDPDWPGDGECDDECMCAEGKNDGGDCEGDKAKNKANRTLKKKRKRVKRVKKCADSQCESGSGVSVMAFVFGFRLNGAYQADTTYPRENVYRAKSVIAWALDDDKDFALVRLDRPVPAHVADPIALDPRTQSVTAGVSVSVAGHPTGLPLKGAFGRHSRVSTKRYPYVFEANLDVYGGNSGSPVFSDAGNVVGILVYGRDDFMVD